MFACFVEKVSSEQVNLLGSIVIFLALMVICEEAQISSNYNIWSFYICNLKCEGFY